MIVVTLRKSPELRVTYLWFLMAPRGLHSVAALASSTISVVIRLRQESNDLHWRMFTPLEFQLDEMDLYQAKCEHVLAFESHLDILDFRGRYR